MEPLRTSRSREAPDRHAQGHVHAGRPRQLVGADLVEQPERELIVQLGQDEVGAGQLAAVSGHELEPVVRADQHDSACRRLVEQPAEPALLHAGA